MANTNIMKATWEIFYDLQDKNLTMFAQYTAGPWEYIGTQGVIQGTFETLGAVGDQHFGGSLALSQWAFSTIEICGENGSSILVKLRSAYCGRLQARYCRFFCSTC